MMFFLLAATVAFAQGPCDHQLTAKLQINTSNKGKQGEFERLFHALGREVSFTAHDVREADADPLTVIVQKASQFDRILVEDTGLYVEGADVGANIRCLLERLPEYIGRKATWTAHLAYRVKDHVYISTGEVHGRIVPARGDGFGFDPVFEPEHETKTLGEAKPDHLNARALAVANLLANIDVRRVEAILNWPGPWQH